MDSERCSIVLVNDPFRSILFEDHKQNRALKVKTSFSYQSLLIHRVFLLEPQFNSDTRQSQH